MNTALILLGVLIVLVGLTDGDVVHDEYDGFRH